MFYAIAFIQQEKSDLNDRTAILPMLTLAIIEVQSIISLGDEDDIRWETPECRTVSQRYMV